MELLNFRTNLLLEDFCNAVGPPFFYTGIWECMLSCPSVRLYGATFLLNHLNKRQSMEDQLHMVGLDIDLMVSARVMLWLAVCIFSCLTLYMCQPVCLHCFGICLLKFFPLLWDPLFSSIVIVLQQIKHRSQSPFITFHHHLEVLGWRHTFCID